MTQIIDLGKLRFSFAGEWNASTTYETNDVVKYGGNVYVYTYGLKTSTQLPTNTVYWALMVEGIKFKGVFSGATAYKVGDAIAHGGKVYIAVADTTGNTPPNLTYWSQFADGIQYEGDYSGTTQYQKNDLVKYGSSAYIAKQDSTGNLPTNETFWAKLVEGISAAGAWSASTAYVPNDLVAYGANQYKAIANNTNQLPTTAAGALNSAYWALQTEGIRSRGEWATATEYYINDVVSRGGNSYICVVRNAATTFEADLAASKWIKFNGGVRWRGVWAAGVSYLKDDVVKDAVGSAYIAAQDHTSGGSFGTDSTAGKWAVFVLGGADILPAIQASDVGQSLTVKADGSGLDWLGATQSEKVFYVAAHGTDVATAGKNLASPFASIKYATTVCGEGATIFVKTGTYDEQLPITIPANTAIVGDNQRTVVVQPKAGNSDDGVTPNAQASMFLMSNGSILNKMTFKGMTGWVPGTTADDVTTSTIKGVVVRLNPASPITHKSPYVLECSFIGTGGIGALIDGSVHATGAKTMIFHGYTVISDNGIGYWVKDGGKSEIVSCFTYYCYFGYTASGGGFIRALNGNNSYGTWGATARGFDSAETALTGSIVGEQLPFTYGGGLINVGDTVSNGAGATAIVTNVQYSADKVYIKGRVGTFAGAQSLTFTSGGTGTTLGAAEAQRGFVLVANGFSQLPKPGASISLAGDTYSYVIQSTTNTWVNSSSDIVLLLSQEKPTGSASGTAVTIRYKYSQIRLTGHDFLSIGTGGVTTTNYPGTPTQASAQGNETDEAFPGRVFYVSTDQDGNFRVGEYFRIDQATGKATLNASAFDLSGLSSLRLGSIGAQLGEQINEFSSDASMSGNSNLAVPTEYAVKTYVDGKTSAVIPSQTGNATKFLTTNGTVPSWAALNLSEIVGANSTLSQLGATTTYSYDIFSNSVQRPVTWSLTGSVPSGISINTTTGVLAIASNTSAGTYSYSINAMGAGGSGVITETISTVVSGDVPLFSATTLPPAITPSSSFASTATQATAPAGAVAHTVTAGALPTWLTLASDGVLSGTAPASPIGNQGPFNFTVTATRGAYTITRSFTWTYYLGVIQGQVEYTTAGTYTWVAPTGVTSVSAVAIGGGGGGLDNWANACGSGGGLGWKNSIPVVPGQSYTVVVGAGGLSSGSSGSTQMLGGNSYFISLATVSGYGGGNASGPNSNGPNANSYGGGYVGDGGGAGGNAPNYQGGGGAGGYQGRGGNGYEAWTSSVYGAYGGSYYSSTYGTGAGGGVNLYGPTGWPSPGNAFYNPFTGYNNNQGWGNGGSNAHGGSNGMYGENPFSSVGQSSDNIQGGYYGGGGGGPGTSWPQASGNGGRGAVRIMWGPNRSYPSTNVNDVTVSGPT